VCGSKPTIAGGWFSSRVVGMGVEVHAQSIGKVASLHVLCGSVDGNVAKRAVSLLSRPTPPPRRCAIPHYRGGGAALIADRSRLQSRRSGGNAHDRPSIIFLVAHARRGGRRAESVFKTNVTGFLQGGTNATLRSGARRVGSTRSDRALICEGPQVRLERSRRRVWRAPTARRRLQGGGVVSDRACHAGFRSGV